MEMLKSMQYGDNRDRYSRHCLEKFELNVFFLNRTMNSSTGIYVWSCLVLPSGRYKVSKNLRHLPENFPKYAMPLAVLI